MKDGGIMFAITARPKRRSMKYGKGMEYGKDKDEGYDSEDMDEMGDMKMGMKAVAKSMLKAISAGDEKALADALHEHAMLCQYDEE